MPTKHARIATFIRGRLAEQHMNARHVADKLQISGAAARKKVAGQTPFTIDEADAVLGMLGLTWEDVARATR